MNFTRDVTEVPGGTLINPSGYMRYSDERLILLASVQVSFATRELRAVSKHGRLTRLLSPLTHRYNTFADVQAALPDLTQRMLDEGYIEYDSALFVCTESKASAILATQSELIISYMQTPYTLRSTPQ